MDYKNFFDIKMVGKSQVIRKQLEFIYKAAKSNKNVLILGETGTGKGLTAKLIHKLSDRRSKPFVAINCSNFPEELFDAELFGYMRGSFTGAIKERMGLLEVAQNGTVFLDEIGDLSPHHQAKVLRVVENREMRRIGETEIRKICACFIFATNRKLSEEVRTGRFRKDLYYRINVVSFILPSLRERKEDIPLLVNHIFKKANNKRDSKKEISSGALKKLIDYDFPGNIRELENIIERAFILSEGIVITESDIKFDNEESSSKKGFNITPEKLRLTLEICRWNKTRTAHKIGKSRRQLYRLLKKHQMIDCIRRNHLL